MTDFLSDGETTMTISMSPIVSFILRRLPAISARRTPFKARTFSRSASATLRPSQSNILSAVSLWILSALLMLDTFFSPNPFRLPSLPACIASARASLSFTPSFSCSKRRVDGPMPLTSMRSRSPIGTLRLSSSWVAMRPLDRYSRIFSAMLSPIPLSRSNDSTSCAWASTSSCRDSIVRAALS